MNLSYISINTFITTINYLTGLPNSVITDT